MNSTLWQDELNPRVRCAFGNVFKTKPVEPTASSSLVHLGKKMRVFAKFKNKNVNLMAKTMTTKISYKV